MSFILLEPSGPHRACYGTALPLPYIYIYVFGGENLTEGDNLEGLHIGGRIILKRTLKEEEGERELDSFDSE